MSRGPLTITDYERVPDGVNPPLRYPDYRSSVTRSPDQPLVVAPHTLSELTGPVYGSRPVGPLDHDLTAQHEAAADRRAHHRPRAGARRRRPAAAEHPRRGLAVERRRPVPARQRRRHRAARPELHRRRPDDDRRRGPLPLRHRQARAVPVEEPPQRLAAGPHPLLPLRSGLRDPPGHADVLPGRPALPLRPDLRLAARRPRVRASSPRSTSTPACRTRRWPTAGTSCCGDRRRRRWRPDVGEPLTPSQTVGPFHHIELPYGDGHLVPPATPGARRITGRVIDGDGAPGRRRPDRGVAGRPLRPLPRRGRRPRPARCSTASPASAGSPRRPTAPTSCGP